MVLIRKTQLAAKTETTEGSAIALADADYTLPVYEAEFSPEFQVFDRDPMRTSLSAEPHVMGTLAARATFKVEVFGAGGGVVAAAPLGTLLKACGLAQTNDAAGYYYTPTSTIASMPSVTIGFNVDGIFKQLYGARGNVKFSGNIGEPCFAEFDFLGVFKSVTDADAFDGTALNVTIPPICMGSTVGFAIQGFSAIISSFSFDLGNELAIRKDANTASGLLSTMITNRKVSGNIDPEFNIVSDFDWFGKLKDGTVGDLAMTIGTAVGNKFSFTGTNSVEFNSYGYGDRDGIMTLDAGFNLVRNSAAGDDELVLKFF